MDEFTPLQQSIQVTSFPIDTTTELDKIRLRLLDLTTRNRLLNFRRNKRSIFIVDEQSTQVFNTLVNEGKQLIFDPAPEPDFFEEANEEQVTETSPKSISDRQGNKKHSDKFLQTNLFKSELETRLRRISSDARSVVEETGQNQLFLAMGFLEWKERDDSDQIFEAPLVLVPVELKRNQTKSDPHFYRYSVNYTGEDLLPNLSLAEKLKREFNLLLPDFEDDSVTTVVNGEAVLNPESYFEAVSKLALTQKGWRVQPKIVLGFFSFTKLLMYLDLDTKRWPDHSSIKNHPIIKDLIEGYEPKSFTMGFEEVLDEDQLTESLPLVMDADSSQVRAIRNAINQQVTVIEGPPGTGKSQTITNLIACFLNQGKSVLFVAEKIAALEVVRRNLEKVGLGNFCLELHSHKARKRSLLDDLDRSNNKRLGFKEPRHIQNEIRSLKEARKPLKDYLELLHYCPGPNGESIFELFWKVEILRSKLTGHIVLVIENVDKLTHNDIQERKQILERLSRFITDSTLPCKNIWYGYRPTGLFYGDDEVISKKLEEAKSAIEHLLSNVEDFFSRINLPIIVASLTYEQAKSIYKVNSTLLPAELVQNVLRPVLLNQDEKPGLIIERLKSLISMFKYNQQQAWRLLSDIDQISMETLEMIFPISRTIGDYGLSNLPLRNLKRVLECCLKLRTLLIRFQGLTSNQISVGIPKPNTIQEFQNFIRIDKTIRGKPTGIDINKAIDSIFTPSVKNLFIEIKEKGKALQKERQRLESLFSLKDVPSGEIAKIRQVLRVYQGRFFAWVSSDYRQARKTLFTFLRDKSRAKSSCTLDELEKLESFLADESSFRGKEQFRQALGTLFNGIDSKWDEIGGLITWAENLSVASGSSGLARRLASLPPGITDNWPEENEMQNTLEEMYQEVEKLNQALPLSGRARLISEITETPLEKLFLFLDELENLISDIEELLTPFVLDSNCLLLEISEAIASLKQANELRFVLENDNDFRSLLGDYFKGINTDIVIITKTFDWALELKKLNLPFGSFNSSSTENGTVLIDNLREHIKDWNHDLETIIADLESLNQYGNVEFHTLLGGEVSQITLSSMHKRIEQLLENINHLREWADYSRYVETGNQKGLNHIIELLERGGLVPDEVGDTYLLAVYENLVKKIIRKYPLLSNFSRSQHEESRKTFVELDKKILKLSQEQIGYNASQVMLPHGSSRGPVRNLTEMALLNHEFRKSKGHIPIRRLLERAGNAVRALKPAFMMSPLSVAQFLAPGMHEFDVVIMDEASQIQPHEAFGAIARGKQMVIVGDPKQLPPTTFFDVIFHDPEDDPDKTIIEDTNSILEACMSIYHPPRRLIWHYRSEHESLIAFSNFHWYNNELIIFPSPDNTHADLGVYYKYVEGATYASGKNEVEADHVARTIVEHAKRNPNLSLGIGTFNLEQRDLIEDRLEKLRKENIANDFAIERLMEAHDGNEPLFIKNLENLQGDERDVIFISCTYGPDKAIGTVYQRFGPVNSKNGPRRLNVLFTRAKKRMVVFTSMKPEDIKIGPGSSEGAIALREFLAYAQTGQLPDYGKPTGREPDSDFEIAVAQVLQKNGYNIVPQIGVAGYFIDIGVSHPDRKGEYILGIECDGMNYHSSSFARDRDRLREESIIKRGWRVHRIWSTDWFKNRDFEVERLIRTLEKHRETDKNVVRVVEEPIEPPILPTMDWSRSTHLSDRELRTRLVSWGKQNIAETDAYGNNGVLRSDLLDALVAERPKSWEDFRECIPLKLREKVDPRQSHYLEDIFAIIEESL